MTGTWRQGGKVPHHVYAQRGPEPDRRPYPDGDPPIGMFLTPGDAQCAVDAVNAQAGPQPPKYPGTRFLSLCTLEGRRVGAVTVGESRLPVVDVLGLIRAHGVAEAQLMWPQLTDGELAVLERLVGDIDAREADGDG